MRLGEKTVEGSATGRHVCQVKGFGYLSSLWLSERRTLLGRRSLLTARALTPGGLPGFTGDGKLDTRVWREGGLINSSPRPKISLYSTLA